MMEDNMSQVHTAQQEATQFQLRSFPEDQSGFSSSKTSLKTRKAEASFQLVALGMFGHSASTDVCQNCPLDVSVEN